MYYRMTFSPSIQCIFRQKNQTFPNYFAWYTFLQASSAAGYCSCPSWLRSHSPSAPPPSKPCSRESLKNSTKPLRQHSSTSAMEFCNYSEGSSCSKGGHGAAGMAAFYPKQHGATNWRTQTSHKMKRKIWTVYMRPSLTEHIECSSADSFITLTGSANEIQTKERRCSLNHSAIAV